MRPLFVFVALLAPQIAYAQTTTSQCREALADSNDAFEDVTGDLVGRLTEFITDTCPDDAADVRTCTGDFADEPTSDALLSVCMSEGITPAFVTYTTSCDTDAGAQFILEIKDQPYCFPILCTNQLEAILEQYIFVATVLLELFVGTTQCMYTYTAADEQGNQVAQGSFSDVEYRRCLEDNTKIPLEFSSSLNEAISDSCVSFVGLDFDVDITLKCNWDSSDSGISGIAGICSSSGVARVVLISYEYRCSFMRADGSMLSSVQRVENYPLCHPTSCGIEALARAFTPDFGDIDEDISMFIQLICYASSVTVTDLDGNVLSSAMSTAPPGFTPVTATLPPATATTTPTLSPTKFPINPFPTASPSSIPTQSPTTIPAAPFPTSSPSTVPNSPPQSGSPVSAPAEGPVMPPVLADTITDSPSVDPNTPIPSNPPTGGPEASPSDLEAGSNSSASSSSAGYETWIALIVAAAFCITAGLAL